MAEKQRAKKDTKASTSSKSTAKRSVGTYVGARRADAAKRGWETRRKNQKSKRAA